MRRLAFALLSSLTLAAAGCAATCEEACENFARVCEAEFAAGGVVLDQESCVDACEENLAGCQNSEARVSCLAEAGDCAGARACPVCAR